MLNQLASSKAIFMAEEADSSCYFNFYRLTRLDTEADR